MIERIDRAARRWPKPLKWLYVGIKWTLAAFGLFIWIGLWWQRHPALGIAQAVIVGLVLIDEIRYNGYFLRRRLKRLTSGSDA